MRGRACRKSNRCDEHASIPARIAELKAGLKTEIANVKAELVRWVLLVMLANVALGAGTTAILNHLQHAH